MQGKVNYEQEPGPSLTLMQAREDRPIADTIREALESWNIDIRGWSTFLSHDARLDLATRDIESGEYIIALISHNSVNSKWLRDLFSQEQHAYLLMKGITLLPVVIDDSIPPSFLKSYQLFDLSNDQEGGLHALAAKISQVPKINFTLLDAESFENLVEDLLTRLGFTDIRRYEASEQRASFDFVATYERLDPFHTPRTETWLIESKFYKAARADLKSLYQIIGYLHVQPGPNYGALITNGHLTSAARHLLESSEMGRPIPLTIVEGTDLKRLLLNYRDLIDKYFSDPESPDERSQ